MSSWESKEELGVVGWTETLAMGCEERKVSLPVCFRHRDGVTIPSPKRVSAAKGRVGVCQSSHQAWGPRNGSWLALCSVRH